ncbi:hypothetical protein ACK8OR_05890 [Jannaschia sp. KMU-145]|uniref:hypothetical protein n=1 Tax=Jannaschia halovivens TaxID=3388667 RepID=UPI00396B3137
MLRTIAIAIFATLPAVGAYAQATKSIPCECRDTTGNLHEVGATTCLTVDGRTFKALCDMSLNVTIWRDTGEICPMS